MTKAEFLPTFAMLCEVYNREATKMLAEGYYMVLKDLDIQTLNTAVSTVMSGRIYSTLPLPADLLEAVIGNPEDKAILALKELEDAISSTGAYKSIAFNDKLIATCVESLGGWVTICQMELKDWEWKKKEFISLYKALMRNPKNVSSTPYLIGIAEHQNRSNGYDEIANNTDIAMIGYEEKTSMPLLAFVEAHSSTNEVKAIPNHIKMINSAIKTF